MKLKHEEYLRPLKAQNNKAFLLKLRELVQTSTRSEIRRSRFCHGRRRSLITFGLCRASRFSSRLIRRHVPIWWQIKTLKSMRRPVAEWLQMRFRLRLAFRIMSRSGWHRILREVWSKRGIEYRGKIQEKLIKSQRLGGTLNTSRDQNHRNPIRYTKGKKCHLVSYKRCQTTRSAATTEASPRGSMLPQAPHNVIWLKNTPFWEGARKTPTSLADLEVRVAAQTQKITRNSSSWRILPMEKPRSTVKQRSWSMAEKS